MPLLRPLLRFRETLRGLLRAGLFLAVLLGVAVAGSVHAAEGRLGEGLYGFGDALVRLEGVSADRTRRQLSVNGVEIQLMTLTTHQDIAATLGRLRGLCKLGGVRVPEELLAGPAGDEPRLRDGIFEQASEREGVLACIDAGKKLELEELVERLEKVRQTGDLAALGGVRYALARRSGQTTSVLVLWTEGSVEPARMFPPDGDAPGYDPVGLPRPARSRRLLSAAEHDAPYGVTVYETSAKTPSALLSEHIAELAQAGWSTKPVPGENTVVAHRDGRAVVLVAGTMKSGRVFLSVADLARR